MSMGYVKRELTSFYECDSNVSLRVYIYTLFPALDKKQNETQEGI